MLDVYFTPQHKNKKSPAGATNTDEAARVTPVDNIVPDKLYYTT